MGPARFGRRVPGRRLRPLQPHRHQREHPPAAQHAEHGDQAPPLDLAFQDKVALAFHSFLLLRVSLAPDSVDKAMAQRIGLALLTVTFATIVLCRGEVLRPGKLRALVYRVGIFAPIPLSYFQLRVLLPALQPELLDAQLRQERRQHVQPVVGGPARRLSPRRASKLRAVPSRAPLAQGQGPAGAARASGEDKDLARKTHQTVAAIADDIEALSFNKAVARMLWSCILFLLFRHFFAFQLF